MIIAGDIATPDKESTDKLETVFELNQEIFRDKKFLFNLEGLISGDISPKTTTPVLFNEPGLITMLNAKTAGPVAALANNHTLDLPELFPSTRALLERGGVPFAGAGKSKSEAHSPAIFQEGGKEIVLLNYCWDFLLYHQKNPSKNVYVSEIDENRILDTVDKLRKERPDAAIVIYFHWSIDLETLPYPLYRQFSRALIDAGVNLVVGCHSHCVQGGEAYKDGYIVYGLGNFYIPSNIYAGGKLSFPDFSKVTMALEWDPHTNEAICHWFEYQEESNLLKFSGSEKFVESQKLKEYTPYRGLSHESYISYFKKNRRKKFLIPVFIDYRRKFYNRWLTFLIKTRARTARILAKFNFIKWQS